MQSNTINKLSFLRRKQLDSLYSQASVALLASVVCGLVLAAIMFDMSRSRDLLHWGVLMSVVALLRFGLIRCFPARELADDQIDRWRYTFVGTLFASGAAWGAASFLVAPSALSIDQAIVVIFIAGFVGAGVAAFSADQLAFPAFAAPALGIPAVNLALYSDAQGQTLAAVLVMFGAFSLAYSLRTNNALKKDFDTQYEKHHLAAKLQVEKHKIGTLADHLEIQVNVRTEELWQINQRLSERIAELHQAKEKTKIQESRFLEIFDQAPIGMLVVHANTGRVVRANSAICKFLGYDTAELSGMQADKIFCPSERTTHSGDSIFERDGVSERRYLHRHGFIVWGRTSTSTLAGAEPSDAHYVIQIEDLSELKLARDCLTERGEALDVAFHAAPVGIAVIDRSGRIVNGNTCMRSILKLDGKIEGRSLTSILNAGDEECSSGVLASLFTGELDSIEFEHQLFGTGDTGKPVVVRITRVDGHSAARPFAVVHIRDKSTAFTSLRPSGKKQDAKLVALRALA